MNIRIALTILCLMSHLRLLAATLGDALVFTGACDASAAVALDKDLFAVASDEDNHIRVYRLSKPGAPVQSHDLNPFLFGKKKAAESDIEGAARIGNRVFWISSHGQNKDGKAAPNRHRLFATDIKATNGTVEVVNVGKPSSSLLAELLRDRRYDRFKLGEAAKRAPKDGEAFNVESLAATPEGTLLIGFRNPVPDGKALLVPLLNPNEAMEGQALKLGEPLLLNLGGLGLRDMCPVPGGYYLLAGAVDDEAESRLFFWTGGGDAPKSVEPVNFRKINPEGICFFETTGGLKGLVLSDDGSMKVDDVECKSLPVAKRQFRAFRLNF